MYNVLYTDHAAHEVEVFGHHVFKVVGDEDTAHIELDLVHLLAVVLERVGRRGAGDEENRLERHLALGHEMCVRQRGGGVFAEVLVEFVVLFILDISRSAQRN